MRFIALESGLPGSYSAGGSFEVIAFGTALGAPLAIVFWLVRPRLPLRSPAAGMLLGLIVAGVLALRPTPAAQSALAATPDTPLFTLAGFLLLFGLWGACVDYGCRWVRGGRD